MHISVEMLMLVFFSCGILKRSNFIYFCAKILIHFLFSYWINSYEYFLRMFFWILFIWIGLSACTTFEFFRYLSVVPFRHLFLDLSIFIVQLTCFLLHSARTFLEILWLRFQNVDYEGSSIFASFNYCSDAII